MKLWPFSKFERLRFDINEADNTVVSMLKHFPTEEGDWDEEQLLNKLIEDGMGERLSWIIIGLLPLHAGRILMEPLRPQFNDRIELVHSNGRRETHPLPSFVPWIAILNNSSKIRSHKNFKTMALSGSEVNAVNALVKSGSQPENIILTAPLLLLRG